MYCPSCEHPLEGAVDRCQLCGFHMGLLDLRYGSDDVAMDQITDTTHFLRTHVKDRLLEAIDEFETQLPQFFPAFYLGELTPGTNLREFAAWLLNRGRVTVLGGLRDSSKVFLFVIDLTSQTMTVASGFWAEQFVSEDELGQLLRDAGPHLAAGDLGQGLEKLVNDLRMILRRNHRSLLKPMKSSRRRASKGLVGGERPVGAAASLRGSSLEGGAQDA